MSIRVVMSDNGAGPAGRRMRTIAIGLDGCSWNVLEPLLETGELPNLAALYERSAHAVLESTIPFFTGPAWASFATGCSPAAHGIYDFMMLREDGNLSVASQDDLRRGGGGIGAAVLGTRKVDQVRCRA